MNYERAWYSVAVLSMLLGVFSKEIIFTAPFLLLIFDRIFLAASWKKVFGERKWLYLCLVACSLLIFLLMKLNAGSIDSIPIVDNRPERYATRWEYLTSQSTVILHYISTIIVPRHLCLDYLWPISTSRVEIFINSLMIITILVIGIVLCFRKSVLGFLVFSFLFILAPTSTIQPLLLAFDHRVYLSMVSVLAIVVFAVFRIFKWISTKTGLKNDMAARVAFTWLIAAGIILGYLTFKRNFVFHSRVAMWEDVAKKAPWNARAYVNIAAAKVAAAKRRSLAYDVGEIKSLYLRASEISPNYFTPWQNLGRLYYNEGEFEKSLAAYLKAFRLSNGKGYTTCGGIAAVYLKLGNERKAIEYLRRAVEIYPKYLESHFALAEIFSNKKDFTMAETHLQKIVEVQPDNVTAIIQWAKLKMIMGQIQSAQILATKAVELSPGNPSLRFVRGSVYQSTNLAIAKLEYERSIAIDPSFGEGYVALADLAFQIKDFDESRHWIGRALKVGNHSEFVFVELLNLATQLKEDRLKKLVAEKLLNINPNHAAALKALQ